MPKKRSENKGEENKGLTKLFGLTVAAKECGISYNHARQVILGFRESPIKGHILKICAREKKTKIDQTKRKIMRKNFENLLAILIEAEATAREIQERGGNSNAQINHVRSAIEHVKNKIQQYKDNEPAISSEQAAAQTPN